MNGTYLMIGAADTRPVGARTAGDAHERGLASPAMWAPTVEERPEEPALREITLNYYGSSAEFVGNSRIDF
jgi:hypothetical protein